MHNTGQKAQHWTQTKEKQHPRGFAKARRAREECSSVTSLGIFSSTQSAHHSNQQNKNCTEHSPQEENKEVTSKFEAWNVREHDNSNSTDFFSSFYLFMLHMTLVFSLYKYVFLSKWLMPPQLSGTVKKSFSSIWYASIRLKFGMNSQKKKKTGQFLCMFSENTFFRNNQIIKPQVQIEQL